MVKVWHFWVLWVFLIFGMEVVLMVFFWGNHFLCARNILVWQYFGDLMPFLGFAYCFQAPLWVFLIFEWKLFLWSSLGGLYSVFLENSNFCAEAPRQVINWVFWWAFLIFYEVSGKVFWKTMSCLEEIHIFFPCEDLVYGVWKLTKIFHNAISTIGSDFFFFENLVIKWRKFFLWHVVGTIMLGGRGILFGPK